MTSQDSISCAALRDDLSRLTDLALGPEHVDASELSALERHLAQCEACRDLQFEQEHAAASLFDAAADYVHPADFVDRVLTAADVERANEPQSTATDDSAAEDTSATEGDSKRIVGDPASTVAEAPNAEAPNAEAPRAVSSATVHLLLPWLRRHARSCAVAAATMAAVLLVWISQRTSAPDGPMATGPAPLGASAPRWEGVVSAISGPKEGLASCNASGDDCAPLLDGAAFEGGTRLRTARGCRARLRLADGSELLLDGDTELVTSEDERSAELLRGRVIAEVAPDRDHPAHIAFAFGRVEVIGTKFALSVDEDSASVEVSRGEVRLVGDDQRSAALTAGQTGRLQRGGAPDVERLSRLAPAFAWGERSFAEARNEETASAPGLGELRAKKPGEDDERRDAVTLTRQDVKVRISGSLARTEIEQEFHNHTNDVLEGIYRFPLPPNAKIERLALEVNGRWEEGAFVERERGAAIWRGAIVNSAKQKVKPVDDIVWVPGPWKDPALLEWQRGGSFELRIFPIPKHGARRIKLAYTEWLPPSGSARRYVYPLPYDPAGSVDVDDFSFDVQVQGHHGDVAVVGYPLQAHGSAAVSTGAPERWTFQRRDFVPTGDLSLSFDVGDDEVRAWGYRSQEGSMLALALRPQLPLTSTASTQTLALVVDRSRSMFGENYLRAQRLATRFVAELDAHSQVVVLACDVECERMGEPRPGGVETARSVEAFLSAQQPEGASDLHAAVRAAQRSLSGAGHIVLFGDGAPTAGPIQPGLLGSELSRVLRGQTRLSTVSVGASSDATVLTTLAQLGGGSHLAYQPGQTLGETAYDLIAAVAGTALTDVEVELPPGLSEVAPSQLGAIAPGAEQVVVAKMPESVVEGPLVLRGRLDGVPFERRYQLEVNASTQAGNAFVPRVFAAVQIAELEKSTAARDKQRAIELSSRYNVASRYTSLLVLESPAMFRAFGLKNDRSAPLWSGEELGEGAVAESAVPESASGFGAARYLDLGSSGLASGGAGYRGGLGSAPSKPRSRPRAHCPPGDPMCMASENKASAKRKQRARSRSEDWLDDNRFAPAPPARRPPPRRMVPMRRIWESAGQITEGRPAPSNLGELERALDREPQSRKALKDLYAGYMLAGELSRADELAQRWSNKDPLDADALTARADVAAQRGDRDLAIRILGSVVDVRPDDYRPVWRLARLHRWAGDTERSCAYAVTVAQLRPDHAESMAAAVRCSRRQGRAELAEDLLDGTSRELRRAVDGVKDSDQEGLNGEFSVTAEWEGASHDLDLAFIHPAGFRVSWLGAPTRAVITATDVDSLRREGLALRGVRAGRYGVEIVRTSGDRGPVRGTLLVRFREQERRIPFELHGERLRAADVDVSMHSRLVPL